MPTADDVAQLQVEVAEHEKRVAELEHDIRSLAEICQKIVESYKKSKGG